MPKRPLTVNQLRDLINKGEARDPLVFLEAVMSGQDPRRLSSIYELVMEIDGFSDGEISKSDWSEILDHVHKYHKYHTVSLSESINASKTLAEYIHPKRKQIELTGETGGSVKANNDPLTENEIYMFREKFNDEY